MLDLHAYVNADSHNPADRSYALQIEI